jgi:integrase
MGARNFTEIGIERAKSATKEQGRYEIWDALLPGLGLRVTASGTKTFFLMYRIAGRQRRMTIGRYTAQFKLEKARASARVALEKVQAGVDPAEPNKEEQAKEKGRPLAAGRSELSGETSLSNVLDAWIKGPVKQRRGDWQAVERALRLDLGTRFGDRPISSITRSDLFEVIDSIVERGSPVHANRLLWMMKPLFRWCVERQFIAVDPAAPISRPTKEKSRDRVLSLPELARIWRAAVLLNYPFGPIVQLLMLTAQRRDEVAGMRWPEIDLDASIWTLPSERSKNGRQHQIVLAPAALEIIRALPQQSTSMLFSTTGETVVSGWSRAKNRIDRILTPSSSEDGRRAPIDHWTLHDLRRSAATAMAGLGVAPHVIEKILNHQSGTLGGVAGIYNRHSYLDERRAALTLWADTMMGLI